ncbi:MAG: GAF domain-containing protein [Bacteroidales bacterium]|nr:GAF domain-containing protein [Bacteroidales bacterium]
MGSAKMNANNKTNKIKQINTIRWKAVIAASIGAVLLSAAIIFTQNKFLLSRITDYCELSENNRADKYVAEFESQMTRSIIKLQTEAEIISEHTTQYKNLSKDIIQKMMIHMLDTDPSAKSVFLISEPFVFDNSDSLLVNTNPGFPIGTYLKYIKHENMGTKELSTDLQTSSNDIYDLYRTIKHDLTPKVISLHNNADLSNVIICMVPYFTKNKFSGIIGMDIDQKYYRNILDDQIPSNNTLYIVDSTGNIFYSRNKDIENRNIHEVLRFTEERLNIMQKTAQNIPVDSEIDLVESNNEHVFIHNHRIELPCNDNNFTMIYITPSPKIMKEQNSAIMKAILVIMGVLVFFVVFLIIASKRLDKPVKILKNIIDKLCTGTFEMNDVLENNRSKIPVEWVSIIDQIQNLAQSLKHTATFANDIKQHNFNNIKNEELVKKNTIGVTLAMLRDNMIETSEKEKQRIAEEKLNQWATEGHSKFSDILRNNISDIHKLCNAVIDQLVPYIDVNQGGIFIRTTLPEDEKTECFELYAVFAYGHQRFHKRILRLDEGMIGACAMEKQTLILNNIPDDYTEISSGLGKSKPKCIMFVPLIYNDYLYGVMEFASFKTFDDHQKQFVERISENIASTIANAKVSEQTNLLLKKSRQQSKEMEDREEQLKGEIETLNNLVSITQSELKEVEQVNNAINKTMLMATFSTKGDTIDASRKFALRYTLDINDIRRKNIYEILQLSLSKYDEFKKVWDNVKLGTTQTYVVDFKINNTTRRINNTFVPINGAENTVEKILCISTDITAQQNTEEELAKIKKTFKDAGTEIATLKKSLEQKTMEINTINNELIITKQNNAEAKGKMEKANTSAQFYKKELEKRINKSRKIEATLKEKVKAKDEEIAQLKQMLNLDEDGNAPQ